MDKTVSWTLKGKNKNKKGKFIKILGELHGLLFLKHCKEPRDLADKSPKIRQHEGNV